MTGAIRYCLAQALTAAPWVQQQRKAYRGARAAVETVLPKALVCP